nr:MAG TPA: putative diadenosine tetraphosphatase [Caudoviricetes sp.]
MLTSMKPILIVSDFHGPASVTRVLLMSCT